MATSLDRKEAVRREIVEVFGRVPQWAERIPDEMLEGFWYTMRDLQLGETRIPNKYKELIGLGVAGATRCRYCTLFHTEAARLNGATDAEIAEASAMAAHTMAASTFMNAMQTDYKQFKDETLEIIDYVKAHVPSPGPSVKAGSGQRVETPVQGGSVH